MNDDWEKEKKVKRRRCVLFSQSIFYLLLIFSILLFFILYLLSTYSVRAINLFCFVFFCLFVCAGIPWMVYQWQLAARIDDVHIAIHIKMSLAGKDNELSYHLGYSVEYKTCSNIYMNAVLTVYPYHNGHSLRRLLFCICLYLFYRV